MQSVQLPSAPAKQIPASQQSKESFKEKKMNLDGQASWELAPCGSLEIKFPPASGEIAGRFVKTLKP